MVATLHYLDVIENVAPAFTWCLVQTVVVNSTFEYSRKCYARGGGLEKSSVLALVQIELYFTTTAVVYPLRI